MNFKKYIICLYLGWLSLPAHAVWESVDTSDTTAAYADKGSIKKRGNLAEMWSKIAYIKPQNFSDAPRPSSGHTWHVVYDCSKGIQDEKETIWYDTNGIAMMSRKGSGEKSSPGKGTIADSLMNYACSNGLTIFDTKTDGPSPKSEQWVKVDFNDTKTAYVHKTSIKPAASQGHKLAWIKFQYVTPTEEMKGIAQLIQGRLVLYDIDCRGMSGLMIETTLFSQSDVLAVFKVENEVRVPFERDTLGYSAHQYICNGNLNITDKSVDNSQVKVSGPAF